MSAPAGETRLVAVDGTDALAYVIIRPDPKAAGGMTAEAMAHGISKRAAGQLLLQIARLWAAEGDS